MEKIYMEESKRQKKSVMNLSVVLSFVVSIFAVFSLAMFGIVMNQGTGVSYAAEPGEGFSMKKGPDIYSYTSNDNGAHPDKEYNMNNYYAGDVGSLENQVFCIERSKETEDNLAYTSTTDVREGKADVKNDQGLIYLLGLSRLNRIITEYEDDTVDGYVIQSAIWYYLSQKYSDDVYKLVLDEDATGNLNDKAVIEHEGTIYLKINGQVKGYTNLSGQNGYILSLVKAAREYEENKLTVNIGDAKVAKTEDGKYYQSPAISPVGTDTLTTFDVEVSGIDGAIIVDESGAEIAATNIPAGTTFYVRIPAEKVTNESQTVKVNVKGTFTTGGAAYYATSDAEYQRLAYVTPIQISAGTEFAVVGDTGMNVAQTIYFIGLIVLLCGVGIVYANAKPVEAKQ